MRINRQLIQKAQSINPLLPYLLPQCRTLENASTELRWLKEHFQSKPEALLKHACMKRYKGMPLQYILGTQPFGKDLNILCKKNVLIPRWETDEICTFINDVLLKKRFEKLEKEQKLKKVIVDLCTGSGCMSLSIKETYFNVKNLHVYGIDVSKPCITLSNDNQKFNNLENDKGKGETWLGYVLNDALNPSKELINRLREKNEWSSVLNVDSKSNAPFIECLISNPPYIPSSRLSQLNVSVKNYEPHKALFGDLQFYQNFVDVWSNYSNSFFYELGESSQYECIKTGLNPNQWIVNKWIDGNDNLRGVYGYRKHLQNDYEHYINN